MMRLDAVTLWIGSVVLASSAFAQNGEISFNRDVRPILSDRCFHCHGPSAENRDSEFRLDSQESALADLGGYAAIVPGDLEASELHLRIRSDDDDQMPPPEAVRQLTASDKDILDAWIQQGAKFDPHWSFIPLKKFIDVPQVDNKWVVNEIDRFVLQRISEHGLVPNQNAPQEKWLRRVTFDLTGLPPTLAEIDTFLSENSEGMYSRVVDRLLESDAFAERMASEWLDVARYSDSYGYQRDDLRNTWHYRDWVINAFRTKMPYNEFIVQQLAGDLLPESTPEQTRQRRLATAFNRLHSHKKEGGSDPEEFRMEYVSDRTNTVATAFMGLTFECARCHDHKYDPIKTKEYYQLSSFFSNIDEYGIISFFTDAVPTPAMPLPSSEQARELAAAAKKVELAMLAHRDVGAMAQTEYETWLQNRHPVKEMKGKLVHLNFEAFDQPIKPTDEKKALSESRRLLANEVANTQRAITNEQNKIVPGKVGNAILLTGDDPVEIPEIGRFSRDQPFSFALWMKTPEVDQRAVIYRRSRGWDDAGHIGYELTKLGSRLSAKICHFWPGNAIGIETENFLIPDEWFHVAVTYDGSSKAKGLNIFVNGHPAQTTIVKDHLTRQITTWAGGEDDLAIGTRYRDRGFKGGMVDEFQVFDRQLAALEVAQLFDGTALNTALNRSLDQLTASDKELLREYFLLNEYEPLQTTRTELQTARVAWNKAMDATPAISVMRESEFQPRNNFVLNRGAYNNRGEPVTPDTPEFLLPFPANASRDRLGFAMWLTDPQHPLTARVTVNRYWQMIFGQGLVRTPEDFGLQGSPPTHPDLLDWLARDFVDHGWDVRRLLKMMVLSRTYRQSSVVTRELRERDPENLWLARGPSQRLSAEMIRDNALTVSGLLVNKTGGPPAKPYDLGVSFKPSKTDTGEGLYRRSLYTLWQRSAPAPVMMTMNANKRDVCRVRREVMESPLQAFVLLNSPQFVEASRVLAANLLQKFGDDASEPLIEEAFRILTSREPSPEETKILTSLLDDQLRAFESNPENAAALVSTGHAETPKDLLPPRLAATTVLVNAIMNLDESVRHK